MNFLNLSHHEIAEFAEKHCQEMDAEITAEDILSAITTGDAVIETCAYGFAVLQLRSTVRLRYGPHLWLLYVDADHRGRGLGRLFMRKLLRKYSSEYHMSLYCYGPKRRAFFGRFGFRVESRDGEMRRMTTNDYR